VLIECCLELFDGGLVTGIQDLGGAGLACATSELASAGDGGMHVDLDAVPLRAQGMTPAEILCSESQERMCAVVRPSDVDAFLAVCAKWDVIATVIGEVTDGDRLVITCGGQTVLDVPPRTVAHEGPIYHRPVRRPSTQDAVESSTPNVLARPSTPEDLRATVLRMVASPGLCSRAWVTDQYDRYVRGATVLAQPSDAGMLRIDETSQRGVAVATDCNSRYCALDPYTGTQLALAEAYRNVAVTGATPLAVTNCLNFGAPTDPGVMWQFEQAVRGLADGCAQLGIPVTGGNVSFYNQTADTAILPTPVIGVLGVIDDVRRRIPTGVGAAGDEIWLLGDTRDEFGGSQWAHEVHGHLGGRPPAVDLAREQAIGAVLAAASRDGLVSAAHELSDGGLAQALVEACLSSGAGARVTLPAHLDPFVALFSESSARALLGVSGGCLDRVAQLCTDHGVPVTRLGEVRPAPELQIAEMAPLTLRDLRTAWEATLPTLFAP
jgi:phosphoribosylformylglycinamidine synthase